MSWLESERERDKRRTGCQNSGSFITSIKPGPSRKRLYRDVLVGVVVEESLERVEGQVVSAVVVDGLESREGEEGECSAVAHATDKECKAGADTVHKESLEGVVVESAKRVGHVQAMVARVERLVEVWHVVEQAVEEVLPSVKDGPIFN